MLFTKRKPAASYSKCLLTCIIICYCGINTVLAQDSPINNEGKGNLKYIDPRIGNVGPFSSLIK